MITRLIAYQKHKHCNEVEQPKARSNRRKQAVVEDDERTTARCRKDQEEDEDIGPLLRWKEDGMERPGWSEILDESSSFKALWAQWENGLLKRSWESRDGRHVAMQLVAGSTSRNARRRFWCSFWNLQDAFQGQGEILLVRELVQEMCDLCGGRSERADATTQRWLAFWKNCRRNSESPPSDRRKEQGHEES